MKIFTGTVKHTKMAKTATVDVTRMVAHPVYGKRIKRTKLYHVHDELGAVAGDIVRFVACAPVSKSKKWKIIEIVGDKKTVKKTAKKEAKKVSAKTKKGESKK